MTALQELNQLKAEVARLASESDQNAQIATNASNALAELNQKYDATVAANVALTKERDELAAKVVAIEAEKAKVVASVETQSASKAAAIVASIGATPAPVTPTAGNPAGSDWSEKLKAEKDPIKRALLFRENRAAIRAQFDAQKRGK